MNRSMNIYKISDLHFDVMCFSLENIMPITLFQMNQRSISFLKRLTNKICANVMTICEGPPVNNKINKIAVIKSSMNRTQLFVGWWRRRNVRPYCWKICDKRKRQPWIVMFYRLLERQMYCIYFNNIQCEVPAVRCRFC